MLNFERNKKKMTIPTVQITISYNKDLSPAYEKPSKPVRKKIKKTELALISVPKVINEIEKVSEYEKHEKSPLQRQQLKLDTAEIYFGEEYGMLMQP